MRLSTWLCCLPLGLAACAAQTPPSGAPPTSVQGPIWQSAANVEAACQSALDEVQAKRERIAKVSPADRGVDSVFLPYNEMLGRLDDTTGLISLISNTHPDKAVRGAAEKCEQAIQARANEVKLDRGLYDALVAVEGDSLGAEGERFKQKVLVQLRLAGVDKDEATRQRLTSLHEQMVLTGQEFQRNIRDDSRTLDVDPAELEGLPKDFIEAHPPAENGKVVLTTSYPDYFPIETYAKRSSVREGLARKFLQRGYPANDELLRKLLSLRYEYAQLLGFDSWADYMAQDKMAKSATAIKDFTEEVARIARPRMERDLAELVARKKQDEPKASKIQVWDRFFYVQEVQKAKYDFDASSVREYFSYPQVRDGIFALYSELFGVTIEPVDRPTWHESVIAYDLKRDGQTIGHFYFDMHPREGKYSHAAMFPVTVGRKDGELPEASLVCNFPNPADGAALMEHGEVVTFFHEFGHLVHHLLARSSNWVNLSGINTEWDFVEAPSQLLEEWAWDPDVLARFAQHAKTGEPIPRALVEKMKAANEFGKGVHIMRQVFYQAMSFYLHASDPKAIDLVEFTKQIQQSYSPYPYVEGTHVYASFGHLEGYSSMYYTYQWSLSLAKDIFTRFASHGLLDQNTARDYRDKILSRGGMEDAAVLVEEFLGRPPNLDAYKKWLESE